MMRTIGLLGDNELTDLLKNGNESAFTEIYNRYWDKLYFIACKLLKDTDDAEEIVQEVFFTLWKKRESLNIQALAKYLAAMTRYAVYRYLAKEKQLKENENALGMLKVAGITEIDIDNKILLEIIHKLSNKLPEKCRLVFQYNKLRDISLPEVAEQLNMSQKTAEGHLTKALRTIRADFGGALSDLLIFLIVTAFFKR
jgi:RNA polymerase sigma-70 factor (ECF subfamily)